MREKIAIIICALICTTIIICGVLFWPTLYRYDKFAGKLPVRMNRLTGYTEILYGSGWERKVSDKELQEIPKEEIVKIGIRGSFDGKGCYNFTIYNGCEWDIKRIKLSIGLKDGNGKKIWEKIYESSTNIRPFSIGSCSITLMDYAAKTPDVGEFLGPLDMDKSKIRLPEVALEGVYGYKSK